MNCLANNYSKGILLIINENKILIFLAIILVSFQLLKIIDFEINKNISVLQHLKFVLTQSILYENKVTLYLGKIKIALHLMFLCEYEHWFIYQSLT